MNPWQSTFPRDFKRRGWELREAAHNLVLYAMFESRADSPWAAMGALKMARTRICWHGRNALAFASLRREG